MAGTTDIALVRDRDAQVAIRGFVYQVDLTILRWLKLDDADLLLPERAEDIDIVAQWMNGGDEQLPMSRRLLKLEWRRFDDQYATCRREATAPAFP